MNTNQIEKLTKSLEDLSLKKQLPRRQQAQKPILKYNTEISKPAQINSHDTAVSLYKDGGAQNATGTDNKPPMNSSSVSQKTSNPYSRPISAKDVQLPNGLTKIKKSPSSSMLNNLPNGGISREVPLSLNDITNAKQTNTFMRPTSAIHRESHLQRVQSAKKFRSKIADVKKVEPETTGDEPLISGRNSFREKSDKKSITYKTALSQATSETKLNVLKSPPPVTKHASAKHQAKNNSSVPLSQDSRSTSYEMISRVRNLNYTPTKPYEEVNGAAQSINPAEILAYTGNPTKKGTLASTLVSENHLQNYSSKKSVALTATTTLNSEINSQPLAKPPLQPSPTVYYKKGSKAEELIVEQRPKAEGAVSKMSGKSADTQDDDDEEEDDSVEEESDMGTPSGERLPGDGEASCEDLDEDDDGIDNLDDDIVDSEGESDGYSINSSPSCQSSSTRSVSAHSLLQARRPSTAVSTRGKVKSAVSCSDVISHPALRASLFPNIPPTINFIGDKEQVDPLPWEIRKYLKWRMSPITPNVVKSALARVGFRISKKNHDWLGCFGKHMKSQGFKAIKEYQKLNHFPGSFQIGRKDRLWRNLSRMQVHFGKKEFGFFPQTYVLPQDMKLLKRAWEDGGNKQKWIIKPPASARGIGIKVINKWNQIPRRRPVIVQRYLSRPYLINDSKFDMRIYVYVSCYDPLKIYIYEDGLARFASCKYSSSMKSLSNKYMHLTNYSINKRNSDYQSNTDDTVCQGHKWSLKSLWNYLKKQGVHTSGIWETIKDLVIKTIISVDGPINSMIKANVKSRYSVHELFGFDVMLDEHLKPWVIEVNISPSLHSNSPLDINIKGQMIKDMLNIAGFLIPDKCDVAHASSSTQITEFSSHIPSTNYCMDKRLFTSIFSVDERAKHAYYCQRSQDEHIMQTILDILTPHDLRTLTSCIDEDSRKGGFQRVFPTPNTHKYLRLFEQPRYNNLLLDQYVQRFNRIEQKGIALLSSYCTAEEHLQNPTDSPNHQWNPPNSTTLAYRDTRLFSAPIPKADTNKSSSQVTKLKKIPRVTPMRCLSQSPSTTSLTTSILSTSNPSSSRHSSNQ